MGTLSPAASPARNALTSWLYATSEMSIRRFWCTAALSNRAWMWIDLESYHSRRPCKRGLVGVSVIALVLRVNEVVVLGFRWSGEGNWGRGGREDGRFRNEEVSTRDV